MSEAISEIDLNNKELQQALQLIQFTRHSLFLTGKAGTGKSTLLRYISATTKKKHVILAPTGIAALNVGGSTLHSFFKLPFHPLLPNDTRYTIKNIRSTMKYTSEKIKMLRELELIIIDEVSMVRADIIDFIDKLLRVYNHNMREPFGGIQILFVGDVYQLEPVVKDEDRKLLHPYYASPYFFSAKVFSKMSLISIELKKVYRQTNPVFINLLDHIRNSSVSDKDLELLNSRVGAPLKEDSDHLTITLSSHRDTVDYLNEQQLKRLEGEELVSNGIIQGDFPESSLPSPLKLVIKTGAQVLFVRNDFEKKWVNGTLGTVTGFDLDSQTIYVLTEQGDECDVTPTIWSNIKYTFNSKEQKIEEEEIGTYKQFPLKLAWAITVHKSQGLTFSQVRIDFSSGVFAGGQTYVALSRCKSLEGLSLQTPIRRDEVFVNQEVLNFSRTYNNSQIINAALKESRADKEYYDASKAFDRGDMQAALDNFFLAIHSRYDIEKPEVKRLLRYKLNIVNRQQREIERLKSEAAERQKQLKTLAVEYVVMGRECEKEGFHDAAIRNYEKALTLCPEIPEAQRRIKKLKKKR